MDNPQVLVAAYRFGNRVHTPIGDGEIVAFDPGQNAYLICFGRQDFSPEDWQKLSVHNGPCVFRYFAEADLQLVEKNTVTTKKNDKPDNRKEKKNA